MSGLLIIGAGGHARVIADILRARGELARLTGFIDATLPLGTRPKGLDATVIGRDNNLANYAGLEFVIGLGSTRGGVGLRSSLFNLAKLAGLVPASLVHPQAIFAMDVILGAGSAVMAGVVVNTGAAIGKNVILNTRCTIEHDVRIGDHSHIAPGAIISGNCTIGEGALIGAGAVLRQGSHIGAGATVGAGSVVVGVVSDHSIVMGNPARGRN